ncbi:oligosaccharide flippase family protein [Alistipes sp. OttesenSCG-928-B03]|nr:oligosaccharide flippase family protein [Alistipes sp. OttesenSCG-928-B03]
MSIRKLAGQTMVYGISSIVARLLNYLLTPYLTRIMTEAEYGVVTDMYALIPFALVVLTMGLESGYFRFAGKAADGTEKRRVFSGVWGAVCVAAVLFMCIVLLFNNDLARVMGYADNPSFVWIVGAIITLDVVSAIPFARLREQGRAGRFVVVRVASVVINLGLCLFFYSLLPRLAEGSALFASIYDPSFGAGYVFVANLVASAAALLMLLPTTGGAWPRIDRRTLRPIFLYSLPLLISGIAGTANEFIDRQMIKYLMPDDLAMSALGVYGAVVKIGVVLLLFTQMYRLAAEPFFLADFKKEDFVRTNAEAMKFFIIISIAIFLCITLFTDLFALIIGRDFRQGMYILPVVLVSNILSGVVLNLSFWYKQMGATRFAIVVTGTGLVFTVVFNILLVPRLGYYGAAIARLICEAAMVAVSYILNRRHCPTPYDLRRIGIYVLVGAALYGCGFVTAQLPVMWKYFCNLALLAAFCIFALRCEKIDLRALVRSVIKR